MRRREFNSVKGPYLYGAKFVILLPWLYDNLNREEVGMRRREFNSVKGPYLYGAKFVILRSGRAADASGLPGCRDNAVTNTMSSTHGLDKGRQ